MSVFVDTTLRDGLQSPGLFLADAEKLDLARRLVEAGFTELEGGIPVRGEGDIAFLKELALLKARIICWCRARDGDLEAAGRAETGAVHISGAFSDRQLAVIDSDPSAMEDTLVRLVERARRRFDFVSAGLMDAARTPPDRLVRITGALLSAGADRVRVADTVGTTTPRMVGYWASLFGPYLDRMEFHGHNDLGMATANAFCAVESGFGAVSGTLGGIGERAGNTGWEELLIALAVTGGDDTLPAGTVISGGIDIPRLLALSRHLAALTGEIPPPRRPLTGSLAFAHESGIHVNGLRKDPLSFQFCDPETLGLPGARILYGGQSGSSALAAGLRAAGYEPGADELSELRELVTQKARQQKEPLPFSGVLNLYLSLHRRQENGNNQP